jgi:KUP system potassium uptake protein
MAPAANEDRVVATPEPVADGPAETDHAGQDQRVLMLGALGVVYGDIGTSPIYAVREALHAASGGDAAAPEQVLGVLSLIFWALTVIVTIKYVMFVLRADNRGEGGILSLMALARASYRGRPAWILLVGIVGSSLFLGDAIITPAISVLSAVEGVKVVTPAFEPYVVPLTLVILAIVFSVQRFGTARVATVFGPVTLLWFLAIGISGLIHIFDNPGIFAAINPVHVATFLAHSPGTAS